ncbi:hydrolase [Streptacidiphilus sp. 4-A2]|nr:hydrolase [Streptacidiphilus sp. 4-A2]
MNLSAKVTAAALITGLLAAGAATPAVAAPAPAQVRTVALPADATGTVTPAQWLADVSTDLAPAWTYIEQYVADPTAVRPAIVLDIDNTSLQTYFHPITEPAVPQVLELATYAHEHGISILFVTARPDFIASITRFTLENAGYPVDGLYGRDLGDLFESVQDFKTDMRTDIENQGYTIIANIGNNVTDLEGGHAEATFKLPDYNGLLS